MKKKKFKDDEFIEKNIYQTIQCKANTIFKKGYVFDNIISNPNIATCKFKDMIQTDIGLIPYLRKYCNKFIVRDIVEQLIEHKFNISSIKKILEKKPKYI